MYFVFCMKKVFERNKKIGLPQLLLSVHAFIPIYKYNFMHGSAGKKSTIIRLPFAVHNSSTPQNLKYTNRYII